MNNGGQVYPRVEMLIHGSCNSLWKFFQLTHSYFFLWKLKSNKHPCPKVWASKWKLCQKNATTVKHWVFNFKNRIHLQLNRRAHHNQVFELKHSLFVWLCACQVVFSLLFLFCVIGLYISYCEAAVVLCIYVAPTLQIKSVSGVRHMLLSNTDSCSYIQ